MGLLLEPLSGGINEATDPGFLRPGELVAATNAIYPPDSDELMRMPGRQSHQLFSSGDAVCGVMTCRFDNGEHYLLAQTTGTLDKVHLTYAEEADAGVLTSWDSTGNGPLVAAQYGNRYFIWNGSDPPKVLLQNASVRSMGMTPITAQMETLATAIGAWMGIATGYFDYWYTEVYSTTATAENANASGAFELESAYTADPQTIKVTNTTTRVRIKLPGARVNEDPHATHWRIYRAGPKATADSKEFPIGEQVIADIPIDGNLGGYTFDGSASSEAWVPNANTVSGSTTQWVDPAKIYGSGYAVQATATGGAHALADCANLFTGAAFSSAFQDPLVGLQATIVYQLQDNGGTAAQREQAGNIKVELTYDAGTTWHTIGQHRPIRTQVTGADVTATLGGETTLPYGITEGAIPASIFTSASFKLRLSVDGDNGGTTWAPKVAVDQLILTAFFNGSKLTAYRQYNAIVIDVGLDVTTATSAAGQPPTASTATVFEGAMVSNDIAHPSWIRYSQAGAPEYWPSLYFLDLETDDNDIVTCVATVNNKLIVGQRGSLFRINYLPTEEDAAGQRGLAFECISESHGILNPRTACTFQGPDGRQLLAFVSHNGVFATDGYNITKLSKVLSWKRLSGPGIDTFNVVKALVNDADAGQLWLYTTTTAYTLHYQGGQLRWTGPHSMRNNSPGAGTANISSATTTRLSTGTYVHFLGYSGSAAQGAGAVYVTDQLQLVLYSWDYMGQMTIPNVTDGMRITTRDIFPGGRGAEARLHYINIYGETGSDVDITLTQRLTNADSIGPSTLEWPTTGEKLRRVQVTNGNADAYSVSLSFDSDVRTVQELGFNFGDAEEAVIA